MKYCKLWFVFIVIILVYPLNIFASEWQWSTEIKNIVTGETGNHPRAFLWIPSDCKQVRAVVIGMHNMQEEGIMEHPKFRSTMSEVGIAEIWITPGLDPLFDPAKGVQESFDEMLDSLANISGYTELRNVPIIPIGHSAYASYPWNFAALNPDKTLAAISIHGDAPLTDLTGCGRPNLDWGERTIEGIPGLMIMGEYEWWEKRLQPAIDYKNKYQKAPVSFLADAGHGHFDHSEMLIEYLVLFVKKAVKYRLPEKITLDQQSVLKFVNPKSGWLVERWFKDQAPSAKSAEYSKYKGDKKIAFWYFDKEMAQSTERYYQKARGKVEQYLGFVQGGQLLSFNKQSHARINAQFLPESDGLTFNLSAVFTDSLRSEKQVKYLSKGEINISRICGPVEKVNDTTFTVRFYRMGLDNPRRTGAIWLVASHDGDNVYKSTVQQLNLNIPYPNTEGKPQYISFQNPGDVEKGTKYIELNATSTSNMPVYYYVKEGPANIENGKLVFTKIPPRAKLPIKITVVAWQYGRIVEPKIQTAKAIEQSFYVY